jgi:hypothetical protein
MPIYVPPPVVTNAGAIWSWIGYDGVERMLDGSAGVLVVAGAKGLGMPPFQFVEDKLPLLPGSRVRQVQTQPVIIDLPLKIEAVSHSALDSLSDTVRSWFWPGDEQTPRPGKLKCARPDGAVRVLSCYYGGGLEGDMSTGNPQVAFGVAAFHAANPSAPYWQAATVTTQTFLKQAASLSWFPLLPLHLSISDLFASVSVNNVGQVDAWPTWTIHGPGINPTLRNLTTGKQLTLSLPLALGELFFIDTSAKIAVDQSNYNRYRYLSGDFWSLAPGVNTLNLSLASATADSSIVLAFQSNYLGVRR